jgi:hypothetical protein
VVAGAPSAAAGVLTARRWWRPAWPVVVLAVLPLVVYLGVLVGTGHLLASGDDVNQNLPLRVLVGRQLAAGHLPLWDPWIWSGTPLLAGFNAGAAYPLVVLFALFSGTLALAATTAAAFSAAAVGTYALLRSSGMRVAGATLAGATFAFAGATVGQSVHLDTLEGIASLPWVLLGVRGLVAEGRWRWAVLAGTAFGLTVLAGGPEAILDTTAAALVVALVAPDPVGERWRRLASRGVLAGVVALALGAAQWLPGLVFIAHSQRADLTLAYVSFGSLPPQTLLLLLAPAAFGGFGSLFGGYFGPLNLPEVSAYVGLLPLVALVALAGPAWRDRLPRHERRLWYALGGVGLLLALGGHTPLEQLLHHIPLYGSQRLQGRNLMEVDLAVAALFGWWVDGGTRRPAEGGAEPEGDGRLGRAPLDRLAAVAPLALLAVLAAAVLVAPVATLHAASGMAVGAERASLATRSVLASLALAVAVAVVALARPRLRPERWVWVVAALTVANLALYDATGELVASPSRTQLGGPDPVATLVEATLAHGGRYAVYDPQLFDYGGLLAALNPDLGILRSLPSVQGYGSLIGATYQAGTGTHRQAGMDVAALERGAFAPLRLASLASLPEYFLRPLGAAPVADSPLRPVGQGPGSDPLLPDGTYPVPLTPSYLPASARPALRAGRAGDAGWYFGETLPLARVELALANALPGRAVARVATISASGTLRWGPATVLGGGTSLASLPLPARTAPGVAGSPGTTSSSGSPGASSTQASGAAGASSTRASGSVGIEVQVLDGSLPSPTPVVRAAGRYFALSGSLAGAVTPAGWRDVGASDGFTVFAARSLHPAIWAVDQGPRGRTAPSLRVVAGGLEDGSETVRTKASAPFTLVRSEADSPGWVAEITPATAGQRTAGATRTAAVVAVGALQGVHVPAGAELVTFVYRPGSAIVGLAATAATGVVLLAAGAVALPGRRRPGRRRPGRRRAGHEPSAQTDSPARADPDTRPDSDTGRDPERERSVGPGDQAAGLSPSAPP